MNMKSTGCVRYLIPLYVASVFMLDGSFVRSAAAKPSFTKQEYFSSSLQQKPEDKNKEGVVQIIDSSHFSFVLGETRGYRIFLPPSYVSSSWKRYPVIYFFHGWSERYFGVTGTPGYDKGDENGGDNIERFVSQHEVIVVKPDGYNASPEEEYKFQPYNIGPVETYRQFPFYFEEFVKYIDANYRTIANRQHRAVSGLSMGGFMSFWIGGKYPDMISSVGNFCGSPELEVGVLSMPVEYRNIYMYNNYDGVKVRLHYGDKDNLRFYHQDMNRVWAQVMDNYEYKVYNAKHSTCGLNDMFSFILETFKHTLANPAKWHHIDVYPEFSIWGYHFQTDRSVPGFTVIENVDKRGFRCSVRELLPDGELMPNVKVAVTTAPLYTKNEPYVVNDIDIASSETTKKIVKSDSIGRLLITMGGGLHEIGINSISDGPEIAVYSYKVENSGWAVNGKEVSLSVRLINKGNFKADIVSAELSSVRDVVKIIRSKSQYGNLAVDETKESVQTFSFKVEADSIEVAKFKLVIKDKYNHEWATFFEIGLQQEVTEINNFEIADGREFTVASGGIGTETRVFGKGNGDGIANPGESIIILIKDEEMFWRAQLFTSDAYVNPYGLKIRKSDSWINYDGIGGSSKYSVPVIASNCPDGHQIEFLTEYWLAENKNHIIKRGKLKVHVTGKDFVGPEIR